MTTTYATKRNISLDEMMEALEAERARKHDIVVPKALVEWKNGCMVIDRGADAEPMVIDPTRTMISQFADRTHVGYAIANVRMLSDFHELGRKTSDDFAEQLEAQDWMDLFDNTGNVKLKYHGPERFMLRLFDEGDGVNYVGRSMHGKNFRIIDHDDLTIALLGGINDAEIDPSGVKIFGDLTSNTMRLRVHVPSLAFAATEFLKGYQSPWRRKGEPSDLVWAGIVVENSETGGGACKITPRIHVKECSNGLVMSHDAMRSIHLGSALEEGTVNWADDTRNTALKLVRQRMRDAVAQFLSVEYVEQSIAYLESKGQKEIDEPVAALEVVAKAQSWTDDERTKIMNLFIKSKQQTVGAVAQAMTAFAQKVEDPDRAAFFEERAVDAMDVLV